MRKPLQNDDTKDAKAEQKRRLAENLRANLKRRKTQGREMKDDG